jgi:hypothetical protein
VRQSLSAIEKKNRRARMFAWWYVCIGGGFILLAIRSALRPDLTWSVALRVLIAFGFVALGIGSLRSPSR